MPLQGGVTIREGLTKNTGVHHRLVRLGISSYLLWFRQRELVFIACPLSYSLEHSAIYLIKKYAGGSTSFCALMDKCDPVLYQDAIGGIPIKSSLSSSYRK